MSRMRAGLVVQMAVLMLLAVASADSALASTPNAGLLSSTVRLSAQPRVTEAALTGRALEAQCAREILAPPLHIETELKHMGRVNQHIAILMTFAEVNPQCNGQYKRLGYFSPEIQQPNRGPHWWREDGSGWADPAIKGNAAGKGGIVSVNSYRKPVMYIKPDSRLRFSLRLRMLSASNTVLRTKIRIYPILNALGVHSHSA